MIAGAKGREHMKITGIKRKQKKANRSNSYISQVLVGQGGS
ncbi:hypothetical protein VCHA41O245_100025 [Vibrio chagasii]|nr:hypothetical protein VCHA41O245_100025 [Vibrio chagasii]